MFMALTWLRIISDDAINYGLMNIYSLKMGGSDGSFINQDITILGISLHELSQECCVFAHRLHVVSGNC